MAENKADELGKSLSVGEWRELSIDTPTLVVADADALWAEILSAASFWVELMTGPGVMGDVIDATSLLFQPADEVVATWTPRRTWLLATGHCR